MVPWPGGGGRGRRFTWSQACAGTVRGSTPCPMTPTSSVPSREVGHRCHPMYRVRARWAGRARCWRRGKFHALVDAMRSYFTRVPGTTYTLAPGTSGLAPTAFESSNCLISLFSHCSPIFSNSLMRTHQRFYITTLPKPRRCESVQPRHSLCSASAYSALACSVLMLILNTLNILNVLDILNTLENMLKITLKKLDKEYIRIIK